MASSFFFPDGAELRPDGAAPLSVTAPASAQDERAEHNVRSPPIPPSAPPIARATVYAILHVLSSVALMQPGVPVMAPSPRMRSSRQLRSHLCNKQGSVDPIQFTHPALAPRTRPSKPPK